MNPTLTAFEPAEGAEPIPGYVLEERIGTGGYGEVWKATAPGGLTKAIKFVYGRLSEKRAARELTSLNRIKKVNHPFILTLERIEVVAEHLVIVTEIADMSLRERFEQCCESGLPAIPRDELLRVLGEAADALDHLFLEHSLQHLDVKPENLLLVGKHVKVADFGLLKDLEDTSASLISGLTPKYAPPEVFDGRPDRNSDQYSLAVVYQEMATGEPPFDGKTAAKLASQHLHSPPDLSNLTPVERFAVGKALSKDPSRRFDSCTEFIARLAPQTTTRIITDTDNQSSAKVKTSQAGARRGADSSSADALRAGNRHDGQTIAIAQPEAQSLPAPELDLDKPTYRPTVFVGVGRTGGMVLCRLRQLLTDRLGDVAGLPALQFLLIDTDAASINRTLSAAHRGGLQEHETLATPIRPSWDYRKGNVSKAPSISRRWIYNIPRSLQTEGLRALGRLALLDHSQQILDRLRAVILAASDSEAVSATSEQTGLNFQGNDPRVLLVASIAGGTGGGMVLDLAYAVRQILAESGLSDEEVCGILTYSTSGGENSRKLAPANAIACLDELQYFNLPGNDYPGEPSCGLAAFHDDASTFKSTYLMDLGDELTDEQFAAAADRLATYLLLSSVSPAASFLDACRKLERQEPGDGQLCLRTTGLASLGPDGATIAEQWPESLCKALVENWLEGPDEAADENRIKLSDYAGHIETCDAANTDDTNLDDRAAKRLAELKVTRQQLADRLESSLRDELGCNCDVYLQNLASESFNNALAANSDPELAASTTVRQMHAVLGIEEGSDRELGDRIESLRDLTVPKVQELGQEIGEALRVWISDLVDASDARVLGTRRVVEWIGGYLQSLKADTAEHIQAANAKRETYAQKLREVCADCTHKKLSHQEVLTEWLRGYVGLLVEQVVSEGVHKTILLLHSSVMACSDQLRELWRDLTQLSAEFGDRVDVDGLSDEPSTDEGDDSRCDLPAADMFRDHHREMVEELDRRVKADFLGPGRRLFDIFTQGAELRTRLVAHLRVEARKVALGCVKDFASSRLREASKKSGDLKLLAQLHQCLEAATPDLLTAGGGGKRLLLVAPHDTDASCLREEVERASGDRPTVVCDPLGELLLCYEAEHVGMDGVFARFIRSRPDCQDLASRLHTRVDISW